jgi:YVTN family beta-propeller protein
MPRSYRISAVAALAVATAAALAGNLPAQDKPRYAGPTEKGYLLPNGWTVSPAGDQVLTTDMVLDIKLTPDGKYALVASSGFNDHDLIVVDLASRQIVDKETVRQSWFGLALEPEAGKVWWSGGGGDRIHAFDLKGHELTRTSPSDMPPTPKKDQSPKDLTQAKPEINIRPEAPQPRPDPNRFKAGLAFDPTSRTLYSLDIDQGTLTAIDVDGKKPERVAKVGEKPYDVAVARNGKMLYVTDWIGRAVLAVSPDDLRVVASIGVGEHPNQIALHPTDDRIFVACASSNCVSVIDTARGVVTETIMTSLFPKAPEGSTPAALAVSPDGEMLYVANADNNCVVVVDVEEPNESQVKGFIPTGWYPTAVAVTPDNKTLLVGVGKGNQTKANPLSGELAERIAKAKPGEIPEDWKPWIAKYPYIGTTLSGALSIVQVPDEKALAAYTATVYKNCPYSDKLLTDAPYPSKTAIPTKVGDPSPIKHIIYIIKENRTYDQVFGDIPKGNGDPSLTMFPRQVSPNHHKLAEEFVLLDNLYCNGHVSVDGHPWSTMAYNTDYIAKDWALTYSKRAGIDMDDDGELAKAPSGFLWDACARKGLSYRSYGELGKRVSQPDGSFKMEGRVPGLVGHFNPEFGGPRPDRKKRRDTENVDIFLEEYTRFEKEGTLPSFMVMSLGEDHTEGTRTGGPTPAACVGSNDLALGRLVDAVSHSKSWPETAIFVIEDDAQNGPDHVDAHRTVGLVISPYTKRNALDSTQYQTVSMIRTIELILGLPPLSQFDAAATPMFASFTDKADLTPYICEAARINLDATNTALAYGAERSNQMDFSEYDLIDDFELNEILWRAVKGIDAPLPPAVRRALAYRTSLRK